MPHSRFFLSIFYQEDAEVILTGDEAHHLQHVMRKSVGETVELVNGSHQLAQAKIVAYEKKSIRLLLLGVVEKQPPTATLILCQAICRLNRLDTIVEKGTELGMHELWLFPGQLSEKKELSPNQLQRLESIAIAAMKQCGRLDLPKILLTEPLQKWKAQTDCSAYFGDTAESAPYLITSIAPTQQKKTLFFVGPEPGFSPDEEQLLKNLGAQGVRLHPNILRTDTAAIAALTLLASGQKL